LYIQLNKWRSSSIRRKTPKTSGIEAYRLRSPKEFDWTTAMIAPSSRHGEARFFAIGYIGSRLQALVFTKSGAAVRVISLRRAHKTEVKRFEKARS
jgi:hypothetical protein